MPGKPLSAKQREVLDRHFACCPPGDELTRVDQWPGAKSVYNPRTGRLHLHKLDRKKSAMQQLVFESAGSVCSTVTGSASHCIKLWDRRRQVTPRELARVQGFPDAFKLPTTYHQNLFGNAVAVPAARYALSRVVRGVVEEEEEGAASRRVGPDCTFLDVCAGIGGFHVAMHELTGGRATCAGFSELKPAAVRCYEDNFPGVPSLGDARSAAWPRGTDVVVAGFPCQPFSRSMHAGAPHDHPSFHFYAQLRRCLQESGASAFVFENVTALLSTGRSVLDALLRDAHELGFATEVGVLDAKDFGLPQTRKRAFVVGSKVAPPLAFAPPSPREYATLGSVLDAEEG